MTTGSRKQAAPGHPGTPGADAPRGDRGGDAHEGAAEGAYGDRGYVDRLADRLGESVGAPAALPPTMMSPSPIAPASPVAARTTQPARPTVPRPNPSAPHLGAAAQGARVPRPIAHESSPAPGRPYAPSAGLPPARVPYASTAPPPPYQAPPQPMVAERFPPVEESSDVHTLPSEGEDDDALDFPPAAPAVSRDAFAEFEDDLEGEATRIDDRHFVAEQSTAILNESPAQPFLYAERGPDKGREFVLQEGENGVGRGIDNDVILTDVAVSRKHLRVIRQDDSLRLKDLGSGNGTLVNGKRVSSVMLSDGDRIELGETCLIVRRPGSGPTPITAYENAPEDVGATRSARAAAPAPTTPSPYSLPAKMGYPPEVTPSATAASTSDKRGSKGHTKSAIILPRPVFVAILLAGAVLLAMLGAAIAILAVRMGSGDATGVTLSNEGDPFERGVAAYEARRWSEAEAAFQSALERSGNDPRAQEYLERVRRAREHELLVREARIALAEGDSNAAFSRASAVPADSLFSREAAELRRQSQERQIQVLAESARSALARGDRAQAQRQLTIARNLDPMSPVVAQLARDLAPTGPTAEVPPERATEPTPPRAPSRSEERERSTPVRTPTRDRDETPRPLPVAVDEREPRRGSAQDVYDAYLAGRFEDASRTARALALRGPSRERGELEATADRIDRFAPLWRRIQSSNFATNLRREMEQAIGLDRQIARNPHYRDRLRPHVVEAYLSQAAQNRDPTTSCSSVRQAISLDPTNARATQMAARCDAQARAMLREASSAPAERASTLYRSVLLMVPSESVPGREARARLDAQRRRVAVDEDE